MKFINSINHFRALSIILIVMGHLYTFSGIKFESVHENILRNIITGGTFNFVFISGFLFNSVFYNRFNYKIFIISKAKRVLLPYLILSFIPILISVYIKSDFWVMEMNNTNVNNSLSSFVLFLISGAHLIAYWYIPFIILIFLMSPLHKKFIDLTLKSQMIIVFFLVMISLFIHRPFELEYPFQALHSLIYFTPIYLIGILCSLHKEKIYKVGRNKDYILILVVILIAIFQNYIGTNGNYQQNWHEVSGTIDLMFIQKLFLCLFLMIWLNRFENYNNSTINFIAKYSFPIFFLHPILLSFSFIIKNQFNISFEYPWLALIILTFVFVFVCVGIAMSIAKHLPRYSLFIIGYKNK